MKRLPALLLAMATCGWNQSIVSSLRAIKDGHASPTSWSGSDKTISVADSSQPRLGWISFPKSDLAAASHVYLELYVHSVSSPGDLAIRAVRGGIQGIESSIGYVQLAGLASDPLGSVHIGTGSIGQVVRFELGAAGKDTAARSFLLVGDGGLSAGFDSKEGPLPPALAIEYAYPRPLTFRGEWSATISYAPQDAATYAGGLWVATDSVIGPNPSVSSGWTLAAARGPQGAKGDSGIQGLQGPLGSTGPQGPQGPAGPQGVKGDSGAQGIQGPQGPQGSTGAQGPQGPAGPQGAKGDSGAQGVQGPQGPTGAQGASGSASLDTGSIAIHHLAKSTIDSLFTLFVARLAPTASIVGMAGGAEFSILLSSTGRVWGIGSDEFGQYGSSPNPVNSIPVSVSDDPTPDSKVVAISAGSRHSLLLKANGTVLVSGWNRDGQLGDGTGSDAHGYSLVRHGGGILSGVLGVSAGRYHSILVLSDSTMLVSGGNSNGQLGVGNSTNVSTWTAGLGADGQPVGHVAKSAAGQTHSLLLLGDGTLLATGFGGSQDINHYEPVLRGGVPFGGVVDIACGFDHSILLRTDSTVWAMGTNDNGQFGNGTTTTSAVPVQVATGVVAIWANGNQSFIKKADATLLAAGGNSNGQLGAGDWSDRSSWSPALNRGTPIAGIRNLGPGYWHSLAVLPTGAILATGDNSSSELGDGTSNSRNFFAPVSLSP